MPARPGIVSGCAPPATACRGGRKRLSASLKKLKRALACNCVDVTRRDHDM